MEKFEQAKQIERDQIIAAHDNGQFWSGDQYYNETYGCKHDWRKMIELTANIDECRKCGIQQSNHLP